MGAKTKLEIETDQLHSAAGKAGQTLAGSVVAPITPPPPTTTSQLDASLIGVLTASQAQQAKVDTLDTTWATEQQAALTESPPILEQQDAQGAQDHERDRFPMPTLPPPGGGGEAGGVQPAGYSPPPQGPYWLEDGQWEYDQWGIPQPILQSPGDPVPGAEPGPGAASAGLSI
ncbi:MAG: hypothetical protein K0U84_20375 [Actinomycetia bacterium]|nr:hypothetical protein [Actinomycetes bacterium]